ncbi:hypothetical protein L6R52_42830, partial [Myxococcota bacterium]|nr:hypothetical protein [Myxococcota bacterium]
STAPTREAGAPAGPVVARIGARAVTAPMVTAELERAPARTLERVRRDPDEKRRFVDELVDREVLLAEGLAAGLDRDPEVLAERDRAIQKKMLRLALTSVANEVTTVTDAELQAAYEARSAELQKPGATRVAELVRLAPTPDARVKARALLEGLEAKLGKLYPESKQAAFTAAVAEHSEDPRTKTGGGDLQFLTEPELARRYGAGAASAIAAPDGHGRLVLTETSTAVVLVMKTGERRPVSRSLDDVRAQLSAQLVREKRAKAIEAKLAELRKRHAVTIDAAALDALVVPEGGAKRAPAEAHED